MIDVIDFFIANPNTFLLVIAALSLLVGSFLNVLIYRLPRMIQQEWNQECRQYLGLKPQPNEKERLNLYLPLSHCTSCKKMIKAWHNIPLISYLILGGRCAYCKVAISPRYPFVELLCCVTSVYAAVHFGLGWQMLGALFFTWILIGLTFIDLDFHLLPDQLTLTLVWTGLLLSVFCVFVDSQDAIFGAIAGYAVFAVTQSVFKFVTGKVGMGQGDYKLLAGMGAYLGWQQLPIIILLASITCIIFTVTHMTIKHQWKSVPLPFGPYLAIAGWVSLMWGDDILHLYLNRFMMM